MNLPPGFYTSDFVRGYEAGQRSNQELADRLKKLLRESENEKLKLRQAVKDLGASSEKLRQCNFRALKKALEQEQELKNLRDNYKHLYMQSRDRQTADQERLRTALFAIGELIYGTPLEKITFSPS